MLGLIPPLEKVGDENDEATDELVPFPSSHGLQLLRKAQRIDVLDPPLAEQGHLALDPGGVVFFVEIGLGVHVVFNNGDPKIASNLTAVRASRQAPGRSYRPESDLPLYTHPSRRQGPRSDLLILPHSVPAYRERCDPHEGWVCQDSRLTDTHFSRSNSPAHPVGPAHEAGGAVVLEGVIEGDEGGAGAGHGARHWLNVAGTLVQEVVGSREVWGKAGVPPSPLTLSSTLLSTQLR